MKAELYLKAEITADGFEALEAEAHRLAAKLGPTGRVSSFGMEDEGTGREVTVYYWDKKKPKAESHPV